MATWCCHGPASDRSGAGSREQAIHAARIWGAGDALRAAIGATLSPFEQSYYRPFIEAARTRLGEADFDAAWSEGRTMSPEQAIEYALSAEKPFSAPPSYATTKPSPPSAPEPTAGLTSREVEVLELVATGMTSAQVATQLFLSTRTVDTHLTSIFHKLGVTSRAAATRFALEHGLI